MRNFAKLLGQGLVINKCKFRRLLHIGGTVLAYYKNNFTLPSYD